VNFSHCNHEGLDSQVRSSFTANIYYSETLEENSCLNLENTDLIMEMLKKSDKDIGNFITRF
jgi:hypothetical protein